MMQWCRAQRIRDPCTLVNESKMVNESAFVLEVIPRNLPLFPGHARYRGRYLWDWRIAGPHQKSRGSDGPNLDANVGCRRGSQMW